MAKVHNKCDTHKLALTKYKRDLDSKTQKSISTIIDSQLKIKVEKNRLVLRSLIRFALYCVRQDIRLIGHKETSQVINSYSDPHENIDNEIGNNGNFLELVK